MDSWERFDETSLPDKKDFFSKLNEKGITDKDYVHSQKVWEVFEIKDLGKYHDLYVLSDTLLLADAFEDFRAKCIEIYALDPAQFEYVGPTKNVRFYEYMDSKERFNKIKYNQIRFSEAKKKQQDLKKKTK